MHRHFFSSDVKHKRSMQPDRFVYEMRNTKPRCSRKYCIPTTRTPDKKLTTSYLPCLNFFNLDQCVLCIE